MWGKNERHEEKEESARLFSTSAGFGNLVDQLLRKRKAEAGEDRQQRVRHQGLWAAESSDPRRPEAAPAAANGGGHDFRPH
jgi:hypothetical protein